MALLSALVIIDRASGPEIGFEAVVVRTDAKADNRLLASCFRSKALCIVSREAEGAARNGEAGAELLSALCELIVERRENSDERKVDGELEDTLENCGEEGVKPGFAPPMAVLFVSGDASGSLIAFAS